MTNASILIAGVIYADGGSWQGTGFTVSKPATGTYTITYNGPGVTAMPIPLVTGLVFPTANPPIVQATDNVFVVEALGYNAEYFSFTVYSYDLYDTATGKAKDTLQDAPFSFAVMLASA